LLDFPSGVKFVEPNSPLEVDTESIRQYTSLEAYLKGDGEDFGQLKEILQIVANQTAFTALSRAGRVWTWGDVRFEACLGREVSCERSNPAISNIHNPIAKSS
jgi:alpha-tubulin suppressor-like RCC1 family protein